MSKYHTVIESGCVVHGTGVPPGRLLSNGGQRPSPVDFDSGAGWEDSIEGRSDRSDEIDEEHRG